MLEQSRISFIDINSMRPNITVGDTVKFIKIILENNSEIA
jgi:hypothetical protein